MDGIGPADYKFRNTRHIGGALSHTYDFTLKKNYPGYWVRTPEEMPKMMERGMIGGPIKESQRDRVY